MNIKLKKNSSTKAELLVENRQLLARLNEMEQALAAIQHCKGGVAKASLPGAELNAEQRLEATARYTAEEALRQKEAELAGVQRLAHIGSWYWDAKTDATTGSDELLRIYGFDPATQTMPDFMEQRGKCYPPSDWARINEAVQETMRTGGDYELDVQAFHNGDPIWVTTRGEVVHDNAGQVVGLRGTVQDITERKAAEKERETTIEFLRMANESTNKQDLIDRAVGFFQRLSGCEAVGLRLAEGENYPYFLSVGFPQDFLLTENNLCSRDRAGEIIRDDVGNPVLECMCGNVICGRFDPEKSFFTASGSFWTNSTTELLASTTVADRQARTCNRCHGEGFESVALIPLRSGENRLGLIQLNDRRPGMLSPRKIAFWERIFGYLGVAIANFQAEEKLRESMEHLKLFIEHAPAALAMFDRDMRYLYVSQRWQRDYGQGDRDLTGLSHYEIFPELPEEWKEAHRRGMAGEVVQKEEDSFLRADGTLQWLRWEIRPWFGATGEVRGIVIFTEDITARNQTEEKLKASLCEKEVLLKEIHHRVKNNLQIISSLVDLQADSLDNPALSGLFQDVRDRVRSMALVHEKLYCSSNLIQVDFVEYVSSLLEYLWRAHDSLTDNIRLTLDLQPLSLTVEMAVPCGLLLNELVVNSLKHAFVDREAGDVTVALHVSPEAIICLSVSDNGVGLPGEGADWQRKGSLGLKLVQMLTKQLRGTVEVVSSSGSGAEFRITFPARAKGREA
jgi:PAS domain S-box-containing protein